MAQPRSDLTLTATLLTLGSLATAGVAVWLLYVTAFVLPAHDPDSIPMWRSSAAVLGGFCALSWGCLATGGRRAILRWSVLAVSAGALALGLFGIVDMIRRAAERGDFEGYIVLMGLILAGHGLAGVLYTLQAGRIERPGSASGSNADPASPELR